MERIVDMLNSPGFRGAMQNMSLVCLFLAVGVSLVALAFYGRGRDGDTRSPEDQRWILLLSTWRDSLVITLLFTAQGFVYRFNDFNGLSEVMATQPMFYAPVVQPVLLFILDVLIFVVAALRIILITRWMASRA